MKYCTKEWYLTMQHTSMHLLLKPSERAAEFSEEYFQELYAAKEQERIDFTERASKIDTEELASRITGEAPLTRIDGSPTTPEEQEFAVAFQKAIAASLRNSPPMKVDIEKEKEFVRNQ